MAVKYHCRKCGKRFMEWGAQKLRFKCPDCEKEELVRVGQSEDRSAKRPVLKRRTRRPTPAVSSIDDEVLAPELSEFDVPPPDEEDGVYIAETPKPDDLGLDEALPDEDIVDAGRVALDEPDELAFGEMPPSLEADMGDEPLAEGNSWNE